jgi:hypothetical protein
MTGSGVMAIKWIEGQPKTAAGAARGLQVSGVAMDAAKRMGITRERLIEMAYAGAFLTHPAANRRFGDVIMRVDGDVVQGVWPFSAPPKPATAVELLGAAQASPLGRYARRQYVCPICDADGTFCKECSSKGTITRTEEEYLILKDIAAMALKN